MPGAQELFGIWAGPSLRTVSGHNELSPGARIETVEPLPLLAAATTTVVSPPSGGNDGLPSGLMWLAGLLAILFVVHLVASWAEERGWIHYRRPGGGGRGAALSNAMAEFEAVLNPAAEHRLEEERSRHVLREETGSTRAGEDDEEIESPDDQSAG